MLAEFASNTFLSAVEIGTAFSFGKQYGIAISTAHILKNARGFVKFKDLTMDVFKLRKNGVLSEPTLKSETAQDNLIELLDALENERMTEEKFDILRKIFLHGFIEIFCADI